MTKFPFFNFVWILYFFVVLSLEHHIFFTLEFIYRYVAQRIDLSVCSHLVLKCAA